MLGAAILENFSKPLAFSDKLNFFYSIDKTAYNKIKQCVRYTLDSFFKLEQNVNILYFPYHEISLLFHKLKHTLELLAPNIKPFLNKFDENISTIEQMLKKAIDESFSVQRKENKREEPLEENLMPDLKKIKI